MRKWGHLLSSAHSLFYKWQEIAQKVNANQLPKQQPNPFPWESFQEATKVLMFGEKAEALSSHMSSYIWPPIALERSDFEASIWEFRNWTEEQSLFYILQESGRLKAHSLNRQLAFISAKSSSWRVRNHETYSVQNGFKNILYKHCLIWSSSNAGKHHNFCLPGCHKLLIVNKNTHWKFPLSVFWGKLGFAH